MTEKVVQYIEADVDYCSLTYGIAPCMANLESPVKLLLHCNGVDTTPTFTDASHTQKGNATVVGNAQLDTAQSKFGGASALFDGNGDYLEFADSDDWAWGSGDFTMDCWVRMPALPGAGTLYVIASQYGGVGTDYWLWCINEAGVVHAINRINNAETYAQQSGLTINTWHHVAYVRHNGVESMYLNGVKGLDYVTPPAANLAGPLEIGAWAGASYPFNGWIDEFRFSRIARWTSNFTPPSNPHEPIYSTTKLLLHGDGADAATVISDSSPYMRGVATVFGNAQIDTAQSKYGGASMLFDGTGDYLEFQTSEDWNFGSGDFTIDYWERRSDATAGRSVAARDSTTTFVPWLIGYTPDGSALHFYASGDGASWNIASAQSMGTLQLNVWHHFAVTRSGNTFRTFKDGVQQATWTSSLALITNANPVSVGRVQGSLHFQGHIDEFRIVKGEAKWTANFTVASAPHPTVGATAPATKLLLHCEGADASTALVDNSAYMRGRPTFAGNAQLDTAFFKFGESALLLDGTGDYLEFAHSDDWNFGGGDFTIEWWERRTNLAAGRYALSRDNVNVTQGWIAGYCDGTNNFLYVGSGGGTWNIVNGQSMGACEVNVWHHFAATRQGNTFRTFRDGVLIATTTNSGHLLNYTDPLSIGARNQATAVTFQGSLDEIRIIKGFAAYTAAFTPPTEPYAAATGPRKCFNTIATCQDRPNFTDVPVTLRFAVPTSHLDPAIECIPSIKAIQFDPAVISLGKDLGQRATLTASFDDHRHSDTGAGFDKYVVEREYNPYEQGTFWGKFAARQPFVRGRPLRWIVGTNDQDLAEMETRHYIIESFSGPSNDGVFKLIAKDLLKLADGDRALAPRVSEGFLVANITNVATTFTASPTGIGATYPASGHLNIGGSEIVSFTRSGDVFTITRAQLGTVASAHSAQDRAQIVIRYAGVSPDIIIAELLQDFAGVDGGYIPAGAWATEIAAHLNRVYTATIAQPTAVNVLLSEIIEQAGLSMWWNDRDQEIGLLVLRGLIYSNYFFSDENMNAGSLQIVEQPDKRLSQVHTYFGQINPLTSLTDKSNYRSVSYIADLQSEEDYGSPMIKEIFSRWIPALGRSVADRLGDIMIGRFKDPPRKISFHVLRNSTSELVLANGYQVEAWPLQDDTGDNETVNVQITRMRPNPDLIEVETEEVLFTASAEDLTVRHIIVDANINNINLRTAHDSLYPEPESGITVVLTINSGVTVGSASTALLAVDIGSWPAGVEIIVAVNGRVQGTGGKGGLSPTGGG